MNKYRKNIKRLFNQVYPGRKDSNYKFFFEKITARADATWLPILMGKGYFKEPPEMLPMNYLVRMASIKPDSVAEIVSDIPT